MLYIGDIHITSKYSKEIISGIKEIIDLNKDEQNIIFMGDFVYHFSYDRKALLELFGFFINLYKEGKNIYILAGNHDWIKNRFVYEEAVKLIEILGEKKEQNNEILFITQPLFKKIEGENILFFPFNNDISIKKLLKNENTKDLINQDDELINNLDNILELDNSTDIKENISYHINITLQNIINKKRKEGIKDLTIIHHYYIEGIDFIGQRGKFTFKDIALKKDFLDDKNLFFISGHLHKSFMMENYLCTGSVWCSSPLERDTFKFIQKHDIKNKELTLFPMNVNCYLTEDYNDNLFINQEYLNNKQDNNLKENQKNFMLNKKIKKVLIDKNKRIENKNISLLIYGNDLQYDDLKKIVDEDVFTEINDIKIKRNFYTKTKDVKEINLDDKDFINTIGSWKEVSKEFIMKKYSDESDKYMDLLKELEIF